MADTIQNGGAHDRTFRWSYFFAGVLPVSVISASPQRNYSDDFHYLQKSKVPTNHFQKSLPRLPIPKLESSCERYLNAQRPILNDDEFNSTSKIVDGFKTGIGQDLHSQLVAMDSMNKHTSYIAKMWFDYYLQSRQPIVLNYNPVVVFVDDTRPGFMDQAIRTTNLVVSSLRFLNSYRAGLLEPEVFHLNPKKSDTNMFRNFTKMLPPSLSWYGAYLFKAFPLDMSQFPNLFNSTRIPKLGQDQLFSDYSGRHLAVMKGGNIYTFDVMDGEGRIIDPATILANIRHIQNDATPPAEFPVGVLTSEDRDVWANVRQMMVDNGNEESLRQIDTALYVINLDETNPKDLLEMTPIGLHGDAANRWYDKCFSINVCPNGATGLNFEHSWGDGVAVLRFFNEVFKDSTQNAWVSPDTGTDGLAGSVRKLEFHLNDSIKRHIAEAYVKFKANVSSLDFQASSMEDFGKSVLKEKKISPDSFIQLAFQIAYYEQYGKFVGTYESCSTSAFKHGRTETMRPCTMETKHAAELFTRTSNVPSNAELSAAIANCSVKHSALTKDAALGQGFDRHLFAMKVLSEIRGEKPADFYTDPSYQKLNHYILSTSTLSSPAVQIGGFAPVVQDGFGVGYVVREDSLGCVVTSYPPHANGKDFIQLFEQSIRRMQAVLESKS